MTKTLVRATAAAALAVLSAGPLAAQTTFHKYVANGGTALYDALWDSFKTVQDTNGRRAVVLLSDGRDENNPGTAPGSVHNLDEVLALHL